MGRDQLFFGEGLVGASHDFEYLLALLPHNFVFHLVVLFLGRLSYSAGLGFDVGPQRVQQRSQPLGRFLGPLGLVCVVDEGLPLFQRHLAIVICQSTAQWD